MLNRHRNHVRDDASDGHPTRAHAGAGQRPAGGGSRWRIAGHGGDRSVAARRPGIARGHIQVRTQLVDHDHIGRIDVFLLDPQAGTIPGIAFARHQGFFSHAPEAADRPPDRPLADGRAVERIPLGGVVGTRRIGTCGDMRTDGVVVGRCDGADVTAPCLLRCDGLRRLPCRQPAVDATQTDLKDAHRSGSGHATVESGQHAFAYIERIGFHNVSGYQRSIGLPTAIAIGCGSSGRLIKTLKQHRFQVEGLDISGEMISLAKQIHPEFTFYQADICYWHPPKPYSLIVAWDSTFHLPLDMQEPVMKKLYDALEPDGVLMFTCGGGYKQSEISGTFQGQDFEYSTSGVNAFLKILNEQHCTCLHLEYDQYPENHVYIIAQKTRSSTGMDLKSPE